MLKPIIATIAMLSTVWSWADTVTVPNEFSADTTISSSQMNDNFLILEDESNENDTRIDALEDYFPADSTAVVESGGWYTIAHIPCRDADGAACTSGGTIQKGSAYFMVRWDQGAWHQTTVIYASSLFSKSSLTVLQNQSYSTTNVPFLAARLRTGSTYAGALLQIQLNPDISSISSSFPASFTARLLGRELENESDGGGWTMTDWVEDGEAIDSIEYSILTDELVKPIPKEVQYLADFSCTDGQLLETGANSEWTCVDPPVAVPECTGGQIATWNDSTEQWECANAPAAGSGFNKVWVDASGKVIGSSESGLALRLDHSSRVFSYSSFSTLNGTCSGAQGTIFFEGANCSGNTWMATPSVRNQYALATGLNGMMFAPHPEIPNTEQINTICRTTQYATTGCNVACTCHSGAEKTFAIGEALPTVETDLDVNLNVITPIHVEWR